jgi:hypothetical protein
VVCPRERGRLARTWSGMRCGGSCVSVSSAYLRRQQAQHRGRRGNPVAVAGATSEGASWTCTAPRQVRLHKPWSWPQPWLWHSPMGQSGPARGRNQPCAPEGGDGWVGTGSRQRESVAEGRRDAERTLGKCWNPIASILGPFESNASWASVTWWRQWAGHPGRQGTGLASPTETVILGWQQADPRGHSHGGRIQDPSADRT